MFLKIKKLSEVCQINPPKKEAKQKLSESDLVSFVPMNNLGIGTKEIVLDENRPFGEVVGSYTYFSENEVLLAKITPCFENGKLGIARDLTNGIGFGSSEYVVFRSKGEIEPDYLFYFLARDSFKREGAHAMSGAVGHKRVSKEFIANYLVPVPSIAEQKRIVALLDEVFEGIDGAIANTEKNLANACELFESYLNATFTRKGDDWIEKRLDRICSIKHGFAFKGEFFTNEETDYIVLTPGSFYESGGYREQGPKTKYYTGEIPEDYTLNEGDFLFAMTEQAVGLLGSSLIVPESDRFLHNQRLGLVQVFDDVAWHNDFFFHQFNTTRFRADVQDSASGAKVRHTSPKKLGAISVCFPPTVQAQKQVSDKLNALHAETQRLEAIYQQKIAALNELKQSILQKAFTGELTAEAGDRAVEGAKEVVAA